MNILITGAKGFAGRNLTVNLQAVKDGKNKTKNIKIDNIFEFDIDTPLEKLEQFCKEADFVFNLAGVNRPKKPEEFKTGNVDFVSVLLNTLKKYKNNCPVMLASSVQATLEGRYAGSEYGKTKLAGEELFFNYAKETGAPVYVYRFPNLFGKWCRPNYNSAVATFCHNIANNLPIQINDRATELELLYIDDLVEEMFCALEGKPHCCNYEGVNPLPIPDGKYCYCPVTHKVSLGKIADLLGQFREQAKTLVMPDMPAGSFAKKLYATYLSYLPKEAVVSDLIKHSDDRGSFTELLRTVSGGQFSVNITKPGVVKGNHWHNTKLEFFIVVSGQGRVEQRKLNTDEVWAFDVSGDKPQIVRTLPGYVHNLINTSKTEPLITLIWVNECFDPSKPDTVFEEVHK